LDKIAQKEASLKKKEEKKRIKAQKQEISHKEASSTQVEKQENKPLPKRRTKEAIGKTSMSKPNSMPIEQKPMEKVP
jgi:hypothetical protein